MSARAPRPTPSAWWLVVGAAAVIGVGNQLTHDYAGWVHWAGIAIVLSGWAMIWAAMDARYHQGRRDERKDQS